MLREAYPYYLAGRAVQPNSDLVVTNKYTGQVACRVALADTQAIDAGIAAAAAAFEQTRRLPTRLVAWSRQRAQDPGMYAT
jgi:aldehyde dehydrogenase (NAD+)